MLKGGTLSVFSLLIIIGIINLWAMLGSHHLAASITKPMLIPSLIAFLLSLTNQADSIKPKLTLLIIALLFSWVGDIALMFDTVHPDFFLLGIACFFIAQLLYTYLFVVCGHQNYSIKLFVISCLYLLYGALLYGQLWHALEGTMRIFVGIYALAITSMGIASANRFTVRNRQSFILGIIGGGLFIISDSCIAYNAFIEPFERASFIIMSTYIVAQILIVLSIQPYTVHKKQSTSL